MKHE
jgi:hypothetical protein